MSIDSNIVAALASQPEALAVYLAACEQSDTGVQVEAPASKPKAGSRPKATPKATPAKAEVWTVRQTDRGKSPSGALLWRAFTCGAITLPKGITDAFTLGEAIAKTTGAKLEVV